MPWLFIHGVGSTSQTWSKQHRLPFALQFCDLPSRPQILPNHLIVSLAEWCLDLVSEPAVVVGHSMGVAIAQIMAILNPNAVKALILVGTGPRLPVNPDLLEQLVKNPEQAVENIARWSLARHYDSALYEASLAVLQKISADRILHELTACSLFDSRSLLSRYTGPLFLIRGAEDRMTPQVLSDEFLSIRPNMPIYTIPHSGHMVMLEQPELFNQTLLTIAEQIPGATGKPRERQ